MRRTTTLTAGVAGTVLAGASLLVAPTALATPAAAATCRGEAATIVGTTPALAGTAGRDVIVTGSSTEVRAGAGDDLVCVTGTGANSNVVDLDAGPGDDVVDSTAMPRGYDLTAILGDGSDTFVGGTGGDSVVAGPAATFYSAPPDEAERDVIDTGAGQDEVTSGGPGLANDDEIRTGSGADSVTWSGRMGVGGVLDLGTGRDRLVPRASGQTYAINLVTGTLSRDGGRDATFSSVEDLTVRPEPGLGTVAVRGTERRDVVEVTAPATVIADMRDGKDVVDVEGPRTDSFFDLGSGTDTLRIASPSGSVDLDLARGTLVVDDVPGSSVTNIEDAFVSASRATVLGDSYANNLWVTGCRVVVNGRGGRDAIEHSNFDADIEAGYDCAADRVVLRGGSGDDRLEGSVRADRIFGGRGDDRIDTASARSGVNRAWGGPGDDRIAGGGARDALRGGPGADVLEGGRGRDTLLGGPGRDRVVGGADRDRCRAEVERACER